MYNYTTAKLIQQEFRGGLHQGMLDPEVSFSYGDVLDDFADSSGLWKDAQRYLIFNAINSIYPAAITEIYRGAEDQRPTTPHLDVLPCTRTEHTTMGAILNDEATVDGNYEALDNIFRNQLGLNKNDDFQKRLFLVHGDQKKMRFNTVMSATKA